MIYAAAQDGDGTWQQLSLDASGHATFEITGGYHGAVARCFAPVVVARFDVEAPEPWAPCGGGATFVETSGAINPATATVWMQDDMSWQNDGTYRVVTNQGYRDLIAVDVDRVLILRDQWVDARVGDRRIDLDVVSDGFGLTTLTPTVTGHGTAPFTPFTEIFTTLGTYARISSTAFAVVPTAQRVWSDRVVIGARLESNGHTQTAQRELWDDTAPALTFEPLPDLTVDRAGLHWGEGWDFAAVTYRPVTATSAQAQLMVTAAWGTASGATTVPLVDAAALPGWDARWGLPTAGDTVDANAWAGVGYISSDYRTDAVETSLTW